MRLSRSHQGSSARGWAVLLAVAASAWSCAGDPPAPAADEVRPNVLLVTIETLRADHVSAYGYDRRTTPFIDSLAARGLLFERAHATSSWTLPSLTSILTSTYTSEHGVGSRGPAAGTTQALPERLAVLPELMRAAGYRTYGITASLQTNEAMGYGRGFDRYLNPGSVECRRVATELEAWLPELGGQRNWFLWLHLFDPHGPYHPREPGLSEFWPAERARHTDLDAALPQQLFNRREELAEAELDYIEALYDSEIRHADQCLAGIYQALPEPEQLLVVVTSDHGEEFMERGRLLHAQTLFEESIRVPLVVRPPGGAPAERVERPASLVDVAPTILAAVGAAVPPESRGHSLLLRDGRPPRGGPVYSELLSRSDLRTVTDGRWKLMRENGRSRLFDLTADSRESVDLGSEQPAELARLRSSLDRFEALAARRLQQGDEVTRTAEELEALRALGYID